MKRFGMAGLAFLLLTGYVMAANAQTKGESKTPLTGFEHVVGAEGAPPPGTIVEPCANLALSDFSGVKDAPSQVIDSKIRKGEGGNSTICLVNGYSASTIGWRVWLPLAGKWNGRMAETGCGGRCADIMDVACERLVERGYGCIGSDLGHKGTSYDNVFAVDNPLAAIDFGFRATHVANLIGREIIKAYYGKEPSFVYYFGSSTGGRQGLAEAQRFPDDFNGIVASEPGLVRPTVHNGSQTQGSVNITDILAPGGAPIITAMELEMISAYVNSKCDMQDNVKDGFMADPRACKYDPGELLCKGVKTSQCLTQPQIEALRRVYAKRIDPKTGIVISYAILPGSEARWIGAYISREGGAGRYRSRNLNSTYRYPYSPIFEDSSNVDLRPFKIAGGKLILVHGWMDEVIPPQGTIDYYETVERVMGGRDKTTDFVRLFMIPGMSHFAGAGGAENVDFIAAIENWVEKGQSPDRLVGYKTKNGFMQGPVVDIKDLTPENTVWTRPVFPYPAQARYTGKGNSNDQANFAAFVPK